MADFIANVIAVLNDSQLKKLDDIEKNPINVKVNAGDIRSQVESALSGEFTIRVSPTISGNGAKSAAKSMAKTMNAQIRNVVSPGIRDSIAAGLNARGIFDDDLTDSLANNLTKNLDGAVKASIKNVRAVMKDGRLSKVIVDALDETGNEISQTTSINKKGKKTVTTTIKKRFAETAKAVTESNKKMADSIRYGIDTRATEASLTKLTAKYQKYGKASKDAVEIYERLMGKDGKSGLFNELKNHGALSDDSLVQKFEEYEKLTKTLGSILDINKSQGDFLADYTKSKSLDGRMATWMKNNTKAAKAYGDEIRMLQNALKDYNLTQAQYENIQKRFKEIDADAALKGLKGKSLWDQVKAAGTQMLGFISVGQVIDTAVRGFKEMYRAVYDIDTAMTNLKKVTNESESTYASFLDRSTTSAQELGRTVSSMVEQTANWSKLGYSLPEAEELSKLSSIYANVAEVSDETAVSDIVTALKAYGLETSEAIRVVDSLNELGNRYAVSAADLGDGLSKSASAMNAAGTDMYKTLAMLTGGAEITQNAGEFGSFLKVASMRIRGMKGALEELGEEVDPTVDSISKVQTQILNLTGGKVNIFDDAGEFRDYYDIMSEIAAVYDDLASTEQANLSEILFGKMRGNQGQALIQAFQSGQIQKAYKDAVNSAGSAAKEQEAWMESLQAKTQQFQAAWQGLSQTVLSSDFLKGAVDTGTGFLNVLTGIVDQVGILGTVAGTGGVFAFFKSLD